MKTFTLLLLLFAATFTGFGQTEIFNHTFDADTEGWAAAAGTATVTWDAGTLKLETTANNDRAAYDATITGAGEYTLTFKVMTNTAGTVKIKPIIRQHSDNIAGDALKLTGGGTWDDYSYTFTLTAGDDEINIRLQEVAPDNVATYNFDDVVLTKEPCAGFAVTAATVGGGTNVITSPLPCYPTGTVVEFTATPSYHWAFDSWSGDLTGIASPASFTVGTADATVTANFALESGFDYDFLFDTDDETEGWEGVNGTIDGVASSILTFTPIATKYAKLKLPNFPVPADDYNWIRIKVKNNSTGDNELFFISSLGRASIAVTTSDATEQTYEIQLDTIGVGNSGATTWIGTAEDITLRFGDATASVSTGTGSFEINSIEFYHDAGTAVKLNVDDVISVYPNPAKEVLNVVNAAGSQITVYNITGKQVYSRVAVSDNASFNISKLNKGIYFVTIKSATGIKTSKVIVE